MTDDLVATMIRAKFDRECRVCRRAVVSDPEWRATTTLLGLGYGVDKGMGPAPRASRGRRRRASGSANGESGCSRHGRRSG